MIILYQYLLCRRTYDELRGDLFLSLGLLLK